ncbi:AraC family transcriptional regulator [Paenibacillus sp. GCM10027626]|uniref:AraC family transcriptional regulator n=1 Tax=Paenibacillus sp. GCM10027626 TaxID=3273411 RepID=UPI00363DC470
MADNPIYLTDYPNMDTAFPYSIKIETVTNVIPHRHDFLEFILVLEGSGEQIINGIRHRMEPGTLIFLLPYQFHAIQCEPGTRMLLYICNFDLELLFHSREGEWGLASIVLDDSEGLPPFVQLNEPEMTLVAGLFDSMMEEYAGSERMRNIFIKAKLLEALVLFDRCRFKRHAEHGSASAANKHNARPENVWQVIQYLHLHYREDITLEHLAQKFHYNISHLSETFKQRFGQNFIHFLHGLRIRHACGLLTSTDLSVSHIAYEVGFGSFQTFSRAFQKMKGVSPTAYRKLMQRGMPSEGSAGSEI